MCSCAQSSCVYFVCSMCIEIDLEISAGFSIASAYIIQFTGAFVYFKFSLCSGFAPVSALCFFH